MPHKHHKEMRQYAEDATILDEPWEIWEYKDHTWHNCKDHPHWHDSLEYRRKQKFININGYEVPEPVRTPLKNNEKYYHVNLYYEHGFLSETWTGNDFDMWLLKRGVIHLTEENAKIHSDALISFTRIL